MVIRREGDMEGRWRGDGERDIWRDICEER